MKFLFGLFGKLFGNLKTYLLIGASIGLGVMTILFQHEKLARTHDKLKQAVKARKDVENAHKVDNAVGDMSDSDVADELHKYDRD